VAYLYVLNVTDKKNRSSTLKWVRFSYSRLPEGCMQKTTFYRAMQELLDAGFLRRSIAGGWHNKKTVYEIMYL
jgi:hypothetical protein